MMNDQGILNAWRGCRKGPLVRGIDIGARQILKRISEKQFGKM
jgi:hypothetical protein